MTTAFVLSGGGSLGSVQVGMIQALLEHGVRPDFIVGSSVGALNGAWLAGDATVDGAHELGEVWKELRRSDVFPTGLLGGLAGFLGFEDHLVSSRGIRRLLRRHLRFSRLEDAPVPLHVVATDVLSGADVRLSTGSAVDAISASAAIPALLRPVTIDGRPMMDGGVSNNTPISHAVGLGADTVWVLATGHACGIEAPPSSALGMGLLGLSLVINQSLALDVQLFEPQVDLRLVPTLCPLTVSLADFSQAGEIIERAHAQTRQWLEGARPSPGQATLLAPHGH